MDALGHSFTNYVENEDGSRSAKCDRCDAVDVIDHEHSYEAVVTAPTCTEKGFTTYTCSICGDSYKSDEVAALGHDFKNYTSNNDATCASDGTKTGKCERCGAEDTKTDEGTKLPHSYKTTVIDPTCTLNGYTIYTCEECKYSYVGDEVKALGHAWSEYVKQDNGTEIAVCDRCGAENVKKVNAPTVNDPGNTEIENVKTGESGDAIPWIALTLSIMGMTGVALRRKVYAF